MQYDDCYIVAANDESIERRSTKQSYTLLENFIVENKRFPFSSGPDDEPRLYRFWYNQTYCYNHGDMDVENKQIYDYINTKYDNYKVSQSDYIWYKRYIELGIIKKDEKGLFIKQKNTIKTESAIKKRLYDKNKTKQKTELSFDNSVFVSPKRLLLNYASSAKYLMVLTI